jgi:hypothetical protein
VEVVGNKSADFLSADGTGPASRYKNIFPSKGKSISFVKLTHAKPFRDLDGERLTRELNFVANSE